MKKFSLIPLLVSTLLIISCSSDDDSNQLSDENQIEGKWIRIDENIPITEKNQVDEYLQKLRNGEITYDPYYACQWLDYRLFENNGNLELINYYGNDTNNCGIDDEQYGTWFYEDGTLKADWGSDNENINDAFVVRKGDTLVLGWYYDGPENYPTNIGVFIKE